MSVKICGIIQTGILTKPNLGKINPWLVIESKEMRALESGFFRGG